MWFSGRFSPADKLPIAPVETVTLAIYREQNSDTPLWQETQNVVVRDDGRFDVLLGSSTVQICTGVMLQGVKMIEELKEGVEKFMVDKEFSSVQEIVGKSLPYFSTHMDLVQKMKAAKRSKAGEASRDNEWAQKDITEKTAELTSN